MGAIMPFSPAAILCLFLVLLISHVPAMAGPCLSVCKGGKTYVYRGDSRPPEVVFREGFAARGTDLDIRRHLSGGSLNDGFVSTTSDVNMAIFYAVQRARDNQQDEGYLYEIEVPPDQTDDGQLWRDILAEYPNDPAARFNAEIAHVGDIPSSLIRRATRVTAVDDPLMRVIRLNAEWQDNPEWGRRNPAMPEPVMLGVLVDPQAEGAPRLESCSQLLAAASQHGSRQRRDTGSPGLGWCARYPEASIRQWPPCKGTSEHLCKMIMSF